MYDPTRAVGQRTPAVVVVVDFYFASQGQTGNGAQFYGSEFQKGESYGERERERERGGREGGDKQFCSVHTERFCSVNRAILKRQQREHKEFISAQARREE